MSQYSSLTDEQVLVQFQELLQSAYTDTSGDDDAKWRAVANAALDDALRSPIGIEALKRRRKWGQPLPPPAPGTLPPTIQIINEDKLAIV